MPSIAIPKASGTRLPVLSALSANTTGQSNVANGLAALSDNTTGSGNVAVGAAALSLSTGNHNTALGDSRWLKRQNGQ